MERAAAWYQEMIGFRLSDRREANPPEERLPRHGIAWLSNSAEHHNLVLVQLPPDLRDKPLPHGGRGALQQIAFAVEDKEQLLAAHEFLVSRGADIIQAPRPQNWSGGMKFYFRDPDGNKLEMEYGMKAVPLGYGSQYEIAQRLAGAAAS
jgi:catechol 2,3-dioxygenase-like lactoylglutathione lyase family enzyme